MGTDGEDTIDGEVADGEMGTSDGEVAARARRSPKTLFRRKGGAGGSSKASRAPLMNRPVEPHDDCFKENVGKIDVMGTNAVYQFNVEVHDIMKWFEGKWKNNYVGLQDVLSTIEANKEALGQEYDMLIQEKERIRVAMEEFMQKMSATLSAFH
jgi:hypothetical protein